MITYSSFSHLGHFSPVFCFFFFLSFKDGEQIPYKLDGGKHLRKVCVSASGPPLSSSLDLLVPWRAPHGEHCIQQCGDMSVQGGAVSRAFLTQPSRLPRTTCPWSWRNPQGSVSGRYTEESGQQNGKTQEKVVYKPRKQCKL